MVTRELADRITNAKNALIDYEIVVDDVRRELQRAADTYLDLTGRFTRAVGERNAAAEYLAALINEAQR